MPCKHTCRTEKKKKNHDSQRRDRILRLFPPRNREFSPHFGAISLPTTQKHFHGHSVDAFGGRFVGAFVGVLEGLKTRKPTLVGPVMGALVGDLVGTLVAPLVGPLVVPLVDPLVGRGSLSPALCLRTPQPATEPRNGPTRNFHEKLPGPKFWNPKKISPKHRKTTENTHFWYFRGIFRYFRGILGVNSGSPEFRAGGVIFFSIFSWKFPVGPFRGSVAGRSVL